MDGHNLGTFRPPRSGLGRLAPLKFYPLVYKDVYANM